MTTKRLKDLKKRFFYDSSGSLVIGQTPNPPIILWLVFKLISFVLPKGDLADLCAFLATLLLFTWAYLELAQGVNYFRRLLGLLTIAFIVVGFVIKT